VAEVSAEITGFDGVNQAVRADKIADTQLAGAVNITLVNGLRPRLKFHEKNITVATEGGVTARNGVFKSYQDIFATGKFQMIADYYSDQGSQLLVIIAGIAFVIDVNSDEARVLDSKQFNEYLTRYNWSQAGPFFTFFDPPQLPLIIENNDVRRSNPNAPDYEIPVSSIGVYDQFRLAVANEFNNFVVGDPYARGFPLGPISFSEVFQPSASRVDQFFSVGDRPYGEKITYMGNVVVPDRSTESGPLIVSTENEIWTYRTDTPASTWENTQGFGTLTIAGHGIKGARCATNVGYDTYYISTKNDVRTLNTSRQQQAVGANRSISEEVKEYTKTINGDLNTYAVVAYNDNRLFVTVNPYRVAVKDRSNNDIYDIAFRGLAVLEVAAQSGLAGISPPKWAGLWTAPDVGFQDMIALEGRLFLWCKTKAGNKLVEMVDHKFDRLFGVDRKVTSRIYSKELMAQDTFDKELVGVLVDLPEVDIQNKFTATTYFKAGQANEYVKMNTVTISSKVCELNALPGGVKQLNMGGPGNLNKACDKSFNTSYNVFKKGQLLLELTGDWVVDSIEVKFKVLGSIVPEFKCDYVVDKLNVRNCDFVDDWNLLGEKVG